MRKGTAMKNNQQKTKRVSPLRLIAGILLRIIAAVLIFVVALIGVLTIGEYRPADAEEIEVQAGAESPAAAQAELPVAGEPIRLVSWNIGYGALGDNADFFMDGGESVMTADKERVKENMDGIIANLQETDADIMLLQEVDIDSKRSRHVDETQLMRDAFPDYNNAFAYNYKVSYVPYPLPPIGKVESGLLFMTHYQLTESTRVSLPCPFNWPVRVANLKRCLLVNRIPVEGSDKQLVVIDLHLEAYDSGEGKIAQTKALLGVLEEERSKGNYVIAGGDFNQLFSNVDAGAYPVYEGRWQPGVIEAGDFGDGWSLLMDNQAPTCRSLDQPYAGADLSAFQYYMIDGFIVSDNVEVQSLTTQDQEFVDTDHNPVVMDVVLKE